MSQNNTWLCPNCNMLNSESITVCNYCGFDNSDLSRNEEEQPLQNQRSSQNDQQNAEEEEEQSISAFYNQMRNGWSNASLFDRSSYINNSILALLGYIFAGEHFLGILAYLYFRSVLSKTDKIIRNQISQRETKLVNGFHALPILYILNLFVFHFFFTREPYTLILKSIYTVNVKGLKYDFFSTIYRCYIIDTFILYSVIILIKYPLAMINYNKENTKRFYYRRCQYLSTLEHVVMCIRFIIPSVNWFAFYSSNLFSTSIYIIIKIYIFTQFLENLILKSTELCNSTIRYGERVISLDQNVENQCGLCHNEIVDPVKLSCSHYFCNDCINEWLSLNVGCPICHRLVPNGGFWSGGSGSSCLFPLIL